MLELQKFLFEHRGDWERILSSDPYNLTIRKKNSLILFMYDQISSNFDIPLVQECRGIILEEVTFQVAAMAFRKFYNVQEGRAAKIDWATASVLTKLDGSIQKLFWFKDEWRVSTMSMIDAKECTLQNNLDNRYATFYDLFMEGVRKCNLDFNILNKKYTYIFELCSPWNRVVVPHKEINIFHIGTRNNETLQEMNIDIGVQKPKAYSFNTIEDVLAMAQTLPFSEEGYVVVDGNYNRVKIKSPAYVQIHHLHNNGNMNKTRVLWLIMHKEHEEYLAIYPEYRYYFDEIEGAFNAYLGKVKADIDSIGGKVFETRKDYALTVKGMTNSALMFFLMDGRVKKEDWEKHIRSLPSDKVIEYLHLNNIKESLEVKE